MRASLLVAFVAVLGSIAGGSRAATQSDALEDCAPMDDALQDRVRADVLRAYRPSSEGCTLEVTIADCAPRAKISSLVIEEGSGHSFATTLVVTKFDREEKGAWRVTRLELVRAKGSVMPWQGEPSDGVRVRRATFSGLTADAIDAVVERAQTLPATHLEEKNPDDAWMGGAWFSSGDFHDALAFAAGDKTYAFEHTGYPSSMDQPAYLALHVLVEALAAAVPDAALDEAPFDAAARALFVDRFLADAQIFDESFHGWVREAWLRAAGDGGDARLVPTLARYLQPPKLGDISMMRTRVQAINALAALTKDDRRFDASGAQREVEVVAADYLSSPPK